MVPSTASTSTARRPSMRATTAEVRAKIEPWLEALIATEATAPITREAAQSLLAGIRAQRDDSQSG